MSACLHEPLLALTYCFNTSMGHIRKRLSEMLSGTLKEYFLETQKPGQSACALLLRIKYACRPACETLQGHAEACGRTSNRHREAWVRVRKVCGAIKRIYRPATCTSQVIPHVRFMWIMGMETANTAEKFNNC